MNDQTALQEELAPWRAQIDALDDEIVQQLNQRAKIAQEIGKIKARLNAGQSAYTAAREAQVLNHVTQKNQGPFKDENLRQIYKEIMSATLALERPNSWALGEPLPKVPHVIILGMPRNFSQKILLNRFSS